MLMNVSAGESYPVAPVSTGEFITLMSHYHRAEIARMAGWRDRIDLTTNWAITVVGAMLSLSLSAPTAHHGVILLAMLLVTLLLIIESRRYRFFDVYRTRVRRVEREWYGPIFRGQVRGDRHWLEALGEDLERPVFSISLPQAISRRLRRNYCWMYLILLLAWLFKTSEGIGSIAAWLTKAEVGAIHGSFVVSGVALFYLWLLYMGLRPRAFSGELSRGGVHV